MPPVTRSRRSPTPLFTPSRLWAGVLLALLAPALAAETPPEEPAATAPQPAATAPQPAGLRAYIDPATGELTSTPSREQVEVLNKSLAQSLKRSDEGLETFELRRGGRGVFLAGRFQSALVVKLGPNGEFLPLCVADPAGAGIVPEGLSSAAPPVPPVTTWAEK